MSDGQCPYLKTSFYAQGWIYVRNTRGREGYLPEDCVDICWMCNIYISATFLECVHILYKCGQRLDKALIECEDIEKGLSFDVSLIFHIGLLSQSLRLLEIILQIAKHQFWRNSCINIYKLENKNRKYHDIYHITQCQHW